MDNAKKSFMDFFFEGLAMDMDYRIEAFSSARTLKGFPPLTEQERKSLLVDLAFLRATYKSDKQDLIEKYNLND